VTNSLFTQFFPTIIDGIDYNAVNYITTGINSAMSLIQVFLGKYREISQLSINATFLFCLIKLIFVICLSYRS